MVGAPFLAYGPRLSLRAGQDPRAVAEAVGLADHPWGPPPIVGLRGQADGTVRAKGYHMLTRLDANERARGRFVPEDARVALPRRALPLPDGLPAGLEPWMVSLDGPRVELYQFLRSAAPWREFASCCTRCFPGVSLSFSPYPRPVEQGFCLSLRWEHEELMTVTLYADQRALPDDDVVRDAWSHDLEPGDRIAYETALAGVRSFGARRFKAWHELLAWTVERDGTPHRAASLRIQG